MKKLMNRALSIVLAVTMCVGLLSLSAFAADSLVCPSCGGTNIVAEKGGYVCRDCDDYVTPIVDKGDESPEPECKHEETYLKDNQDGKTHSVYCTECEKLMGTVQHSFTDGKCDCGAEEPKHEHSWHNVTSFCNGTFEHELKCDCGAKETKSNTGKLVTGPNGKVIQCEYCEYWESAKEPQCEHDWQYASDGYGKTHTRVCTKCWDTQEEDCNIVVVPEGYSKCKLCGWNNKDIVLADHCLKCDAKDHKTDECPNWCPICDQLYILASCGGKYCSVNGQAVHIQKGTTCRDTMNGFDTGNVHDHQCDFCHAHHLDLVDTEVTATCTKDGKTVVKCGYPGCDYVERESETAALGHTFDKAYVSDNCESHNDADCSDHTLTCSRCGGKEGKDAQGQEAVKKENHTYNDGDAAEVDGVEGTRYTCTACGHWYFEANQAGTYTLTINYRYDDNGGIFHTYKGQFAAGAEYSVTSQPAPEGYEFAAEGLDEVKSGIMPNNDLELIVSYKPITYTWTINYVDENGKAMEGMEPFTRTFTVNDLKTLVSQTSPTKVGYTADLAVVDAPTQVGNKTDTVTYKLSADFNLTVIHRYVDLDGTIDDEVTQDLGKHPIGYEYTTSAVARRGYSLSARPANATGVFEAKDVTVTYVYNADRTPAPTPEPEPDPDPTPETPVDINEPEVPLIEDPDVDIEEPEVPLAKEPEIELEEPDVPLADVPETGDKSLLWGCLTLISGAGLALLALMDKMRKDDEA